MLLAAKPTRSQLLIVHGLLKRLMMVK